MTRPEADAVSRTRVLGVLSLIYFLHSIDRQVIAVVIEPLKREFALTDKMLGLIGSLGYGIMFALACLPLGWLIDRVNRVRLLAILLSLWSGLTAACGFASSHIQLLVARMGIGATEAGGSPTSMSLISDYFGAKKRSTAIGICYMSAALGVSACFLVGAAVAGAYGWRATFWIAGAPGLLLALVLIKLIPEPVRGGADVNLTRAHTTTAPSIAGAMRTIVRMRPLLHLMLAITLSVFVMSAMWTWIISLLMRYHSLPLADAGKIGALGALFQAAGSWLVGRYAERAARSSVYKLAVVAGACTLLTVPLGIGMAFTPTLAATIALFCAMAFFNGAWSGPAFGLVMTVAPPQIRGITGSLIQLVVNLFGGGIGPLVAGVLSDSLSGGLRYALAITFLVNLWAALHYFLAARGDGPATASTATSGYRRGAPGDPSLAPHATKSHFRWTQD